MKLLFEKCEQSTQTSNCPSSESLDEEIQKTVRQMEQEGKQFFTEDAELDGLVCSKHVYIDIYTHTHARAQALVRVHTHIQTRTRCAVA